MWHRTARCLPSGSQSQGARIRHVATDVGERPGEAASSQLRRSGSTVAPSARLQRGSRDMCLGACSCPASGAGIREAARLLRPGGHLVVSDTRGHFIGSTLYPLVKWDVNGNFGYIPTWQHPTSEYLGAALSNGFIVRDCHEPLRPGPLRPAIASQLRTACKFGPTSERLGLARLGG